jgi:AAHS family 4-hydroxybenzoate transporter-like MFS transporter
MAVLKRMRPDLTLTDADEFVASPAVPAGGTGLAQLFSGSLAFITPLLWLCFAMALMANYFLNSWLPLVLVDSGMSAQQSGITTSFYHYGGTLGGILVSLVLGRYGFTAVTFLFLLAILGIAAIGLPGHSALIVGTAVAVAGFSTLGAQFGNNAASGLLYPTAIRARGVGWALGVGRLGGVIGPLIGGVLVSWKLPPQQLFMLAAAPMLIGLVASIGVAYLCYQRLGGMQLEDLPPKAPWMASEKGVSE